MPRYNDVVDELVPIFDTRKLPEYARIDREGFTLIDHRSAVDDFYDDVGSVANC